MGTRHLIAVMNNGEYKIAQYGQWDGYPSGQGVEILEFLSNPDDIEKLKQNLNKVRFIDFDGKDKDFVEAYSAATPDWSSEPDNRTSEQKHWYETYISRDLGSKILKNIADSTDDEILIKDSLDFAGDSLFCEYAYVIDFDKGTFEIYEGFNKEPLCPSDRFANIEKDTDSEYEPVKFKGFFLLDQLPTEDEFLRILEPEDEDED